MKKLFLFALSLVFVFVAASCGGNGGNQGGNQGGEQPDPNKPWYETDGDFTYNDYIASTTSMNWNPLSWETNDDSYVLGYLSMGFYDYALNDEADGWVVVPEMAAELPTDVTEKYVGKYGVKAGEKGKAWEIKLNPNATWEDGTKIVAGDYVYSMQQQLDPVQLNRRADSYYGGDFSIVNAKTYLYNGQFAYSNTVVDAAFSPESYFDNAAVSKDEKGQYMVDGKYVGFSLTNGGVWSTNSLNDYFGAGYIDPASADWKVLTDAEGTGANNYNGIIPINDATMVALSNIIANLHGYASAEERAAVDGAYAWQEYQEFCFYGANNPEMDFAEVGIEATDDYTLVLIIENELQNPKFYLPYYLSSFCLINKDLYEKCWTTNPDGERINNYMTSLETSISYGPYRLSYFEADKQISFVRNTNWYGYTDGKHENQFQTDKVSCKVIAKHETALLSFLAGEIDGIGLTSEDMEIYGGSQNLLYTPESYTTKFTINTDLESLKARENETTNKAILSVKEFREAFSFALDRAHFASKFTASAAAGFGLVNYMYQIIDEEGSEESYRNYAVAKQALCNVYGVKWGEGERFDSLDAAYEAITGYDMARAKAKMQEAYAIAKEKGLYNDNQKVVIRFSVYQSDDVYIQMYEYVRDQLLEAVKGSGLEGKVELEMHVDDDYYETLYAGETDIIFSTWGGAAYGTLGLLSNVYCDDYTGNGNQMEVGFNTDAYPIEFEIDGKTYNYSIKKWADWLNAKQALEGIGSPAEYDVDIKAALFAKLEEAYLSEFCAIPLYYRQAASLHSHKVEYAAEDYVNMIGYGGIRHMTYAYNDTEWAEQVSKGLTY